VELVAGICSHSDVFVREQDVEEVRLKGRRVKVMWIRAEAEWTRADAGQAGCARGDVLVDRALSREHACEKTTCFSRCCIVARLIRRSPHRCDVAEVIAAKRTGKATATRFGRASHNRETRYQDETRPFIHIHCIHAVRDQHG
jgi:hypothetical protein